MDSKVITTFILTLIGSGIIAPLSKSIFDKIFAAYSPDPKKINSGIKKILLFLFRYLLPTANLIYLFITYKQVDKYFVFSTCFVFAVLLFNISLDIFYKLLDSDRKYTEKLINVIIDGLKNTAITMDSNTDILNKAQREHLEITQRIIDDIKRKKK